jgi:hypothetical protein
MRRDWLVWLGCGSLFFAGAIWGHLLPGSNFFVITNIHDLAEIVAACATTFAVLLALVGLSAWKGQVIATSDHELARRSIVLIEKCKFSMPNFVNLAGSVAMLVSHRVEPTPGMVAEVQEEMNLLGEMHAEFRALEFESRAAWGESCAQLFEPIFDVSERCQGMLSLYLQWSREDNTDKYKATLSSVMRQMEVSFRQSQGLSVNEERTSLFARRFSPLEGFLRKKFIR